MEPLPYDAEGGALMADAVGTVAGACMDTSTVTSYVESSAGVAAGSRTGLTALTTGILFAMVAWGVLKLICGKVKDISPITCGFQL